MSCATPWSPANRPATRRRVTPPASSLSPGRPCTASRRCGSTAPCPLKAWSLSAWRPKSDASSPACSRRWRPARLDPAGIRAASWARLKSPRHSRRRRRGTPRRKAEGEGGCDGQERLQSGRTGGHKHGILGEGRRGCRRARIEEPEGPSRGRGRRAGSGDRKGQGRSLSHQAQSLLQVRRQRLTSSRRRACRARAFERLYDEHPASPTRAAARRGRCLVAVGLGPRAPGRARGHSEQLSDALDVARANGAALRAVQVKKRPAAPRPGLAPDVIGGASLRLYGARVAAKPISTFISLESGQPAFAFAAIDWNAAWSMPGIFAVTVRWTEVMEKPSPALSRTTSDLLSTCSGTKFAMPSSLTKDIAKQAA